MFKPASTKDVRGSYEYLRDVRVLEGRQFLSVTPVVAHMAHPVKHHVVHHHHAAKPHHATTKAAAATVNVVGQYTGTATINFLGSSHDVDVSLNIQSQSGGDLSGTIAINGGDSVKFKVSDAFDANGNFTVSYNKDGPPPPSAATKPHRRPGRAQRQLRRPDRRRHVRPQLRQRLIDFINNIKKIQTPLRAESFLLPYNKPTGTDCKAPVGGANIFTFAKAHGPIAIPLLRRCESGKRHPAIEQISSHRRCVPARTWPPPYRVDGRLDKFVVHRDLQLHLRQ